MDIKNSKEIIAEFLERYGFSHIFTDSGLPLGKEAAPLRLSNGEAVDFLLASALTGSKAIGFFDRLPPLRVEMALRGECLFISVKLPEKIDVPTLFCRRLADLPDMLVMSLKTAADSKLPVSIIISEDALNNYTDFVKTNCDLVRTSPYLHPNTFKTLLSGEAFKNCVSVAGSAFAAAYGSGGIEGTELSFSDCEMPFFAYMLPGVKPEGYGKIKGGTLKAPKGEAADIERLLNGSYSLNVKVEEISVEKLPEPEDFLCPGCPFVNTAVRLKDNETILFTDIKCEGMLKAFPFNLATLETYMGLLSENLNVKTMFVGSASSYKPCYDSLLKNGRVILLNDCGLSGINMCAAVKRPKKLQTDRNCLFPYSCNNIKSYSRVKINPKKCRCIKDGQAPVCIETVKCPAIYLKNGAVAIDGDICTGCFACKIVCPFGAIS